jgi:hypothetical protein
MTIDVERIQSQIMAYQRVEAPIQDIVININNDNNNNESKDTKTLILIDRKKIAMLV